MKTMTMIALAAVALAGCSEEKKVEKVEKPKTFPAGLYEVTSEVSQFGSTDKSTPPMTLTVGDKSVSQVCVAADGTPDEALAVDKGFDKCAVTGSYNRSGRFSYQYQCAMGSRGAVFPNIDGNYTAEGFEAQVNTASTFAGDGDFQLERKLTGKRIGDCPAGGAPKA